MKKYEKFLLEVTFWKYAEEEGLEGYCEIVLPECLEYRFPEGSMPMAIIDKKLLKKARGLKMTRKVCVKTRPEAELSERKALK